MGAKGAGTELSEPRVESSHRMRRSVSTCASVAAGVARERDGERFRLPSSGRGQHLQSKPKDSNAGAGYIKAGELERLAEKVGALQVETGGVDGPAALDGRAATDVDNICV